MQIDCYCALDGEFFDPTPLLTNSKIVIRDFHCRGDIGKTGRYKGIPYDFGYLRIASTGNSINDFLSILMSSEIVAEIEKAETRELHVFLEYETQCNWEFSIDEIKKLHVLGLILTISCDTKE